MAGDARTRTLLQCSTRIKDSRRPDKSNAPVTSYDIPCNHILHGVQGPPCPSAL